jgi:hypothetical protein
MFSLLAPADCEQAKKQNSRNGLQMKLGSSKLTGRTAKESGGFQSVELCAECPRAAKP